MDFREYTQETQDVLNEYLGEVIFNCDKCQNCSFYHDDNICFFAYECVKNNFNYFKKALDN